MTLKGIRYDKDKYIIAMWMEQTDIYVSSFPGDTILCSNFTCFVLFSCVLFFFENHMLGLQTC